MDNNFDGDSTVKAIYAFVAQLELNIEDTKAGKPFELKARFPPVDLMQFVEVLVFRVLDFRVRQ